MWRMTAGVTQRLNEDHGGTIVFVAILLVVLLGIVALAVDVGAIYQERRELQNGADAAALAIAEDCARDVIDCALAGIEGTLQAGTGKEYADANARDGAAAVHSVDLDLTEAEVTVNLFTEDADGGNWLQHWFAPILDVDESQVGATATAAWDVNPSDLNVFPLAFCKGTFMELTQDKNNYGPPAYHVFYKTPGDKVEETAIECELEDGDTYPGGFGWLDIEVDGDCQVVASDDEWYDGSTGNAMPSKASWNNCEDVIKTKVDEVKAAGGEAAEPCSEPDPDVKPLLVPIFDDWAGTGMDSGKFHIPGFGAFCPTGYRFSGNKSHPPPPDKPCIHHQNRCVRGWFTKWVDFEDAVAGGGEDFGVTTFSLIK